MLGHTGQEILRKNNVEQMDWPARSPDMNAIEHVWSRMKLRMHEDEYKLNSMNYLANIIRAGSYSSSLLANFENILLNLERTDDDGDVHVQKLLYLVKKYIYKFLTWSKNRNCPISFTSNHTLF